MTLDLFDQNPDLKRLRVKALAYLAQADMAEKRLVKRLTRLPKLFPRAPRYASFTAENAWKIVDGLRQEGLVDEKRFAEKVLHNLKDRRDGWRTIRLKMLRRDIQPTVVDEVMGRFKVSEQKQDLNKIIASATVKFGRLLEKSSNDPKRKSQVKPKLYAWLAMRGYDGDDIKEIIKHVE